MRVAAVVIGWLGAGLGAAKGLLFVLFWLGQVASGNLGFFDSLALLGIGADGTAAISCVLGAVGPGFIIGGRLRAGALIMLIGAAGVTIAAVVYGLLQPLTQPPDVQAVLPTFPTNIGFYVLWLFPVPSLIVGAALAFLSHRRTQTPGETT